MAKHSYYTGDHRLTRADGSSVTTRVKPQTEARDLFREFTRLGFVKVRALADTFDW